ncbi:ComF family protein [Azohydromonas sediminis]|uniref:ComF family protein n=1 Tax=Azohydromonas sediminis TaxID=2259674 RepID=UPI000E649550|nr:phosphoribosyltransferase family protein [Azohydromonas sediminis]
MHAPRPPLSTLHWPSRCIVCRQWSDARCCGDCVARFAAARPRCVRCAIAVPHGVTTCADCLRAPPPFAAARAAVDYGFPWSDAIAAFKFAGGLDRAPALAQLLASACRDAAAGVDLLLPVPLAPRRLAERGYNQAWELARRVARRLALPARSDVLQRWIETPHVAELPREARAAAVRGAFGVEPVQAHRVRGRRIALVDDVMTTGATAAEATRALHDGGAAEVQVWALARTPRPDDA